MEPSVTLSPTASQIQEVNANFKYFPTTPISTANPIPPSLKKSSSLLSNRKQNNSTSKVLPSLKELFPSQNREIPVKSSICGQSSRHGRFSPYPTTASRQLPKSNSVLPPFSSVVSRTTICESSLPSANNLKVQNRLHQSSFSSTSSSSSSSSTLVSKQQAKSNSSSVEQKPKCLDTCFHSQTSSKHPNSPSSSPSKQVKKINDGQWSEEEHARFLEGLKVCGRGKWRAIADEFVKTRTRIQVASHAQKYFMKKEKQKS